MEKHATLEQAKEQLRSALGQLEKVVNSKLAKNQEGQEVDTGALKHAEEKVKTLKEENAHLRDENQSLQAHLGREQSVARNQERINKEALGQVNGIIRELHSILDDRKL